VERTVSAAQRSLLLLLVTTVAAGCSAGIRPAKTQLEVRQYQTYAFDTPDSKLVMKGLFNVLQDDGYVVRNAVIELGLITATKETDLAPGRSGQTVLAFGGWYSRGLQDLPIPQKIEVYDFTGNVTEFGPQTRVRVSFQRKVLDSRGNAVEVVSISDPVFYQDFFSRLDKSVYLQKERL
jgi:hypothetical protein